MRVLVPFDAVDPKTRLAPVLDPAERDAFARAMLRDVLDALDSAGYEPTVLSTGPVDCPAPVEVDDRPLTEAVNDRLTSAELPVAVVMADLALATPAALERMFEPTAGVVLAPGLRGGTNALCTHEAGFKVDYHGVSYRDHEQAASEIGAAVSMVDSYRLACDIDEPGDLLDVLLHSDGRASEWLTAAGFSVAADSTDPPVGISRDTP
jgi:2-phospho-L-lactate guanylyltransferase